MLDLLLTTLSCLSICSLGAIGLMVIPWRDDELDELSDALRATAEVGVSLALAARNAVAPPAAPTWRPPLGEARTLT